MRGYRLVGYFEPMSSQNIFEACWNHNNAAVGRYTGCNHGAVGGFYLSARHFSEPVVTAQPASGGTLLGSYRPDFQLGNSTGEFVTPADYAGKTVLINFWATWCVPCRNEMPMLMDLQRQYGSAGLQVVGIALDDAKASGVL